MLAMMQCHTIESRRREEQCAEKVGAEGRVLPSMMSQSQRSTKAETLITLILHVTTV